MRFLNKLFVQCYNLFDWRLASQAVVLRFNFILLSFVGPCVLVYPRPEPSVARLSLPFTT